MVVMVLVCSGSSEPSTQPPKLVRFWMLCRKSCLFAQQLHSQCVSHNHYDHRYVERYKRAEDEEGSVVDDADMGLWHDVSRVVNT